MPILHVRGLPQKDPARVQRALKETCAKIAELYGCMPTQVWATWQEIEPGFYVEGPNAAESQPNSTHPPICELIVSEGKSPELIEKVLLSAAASLSGTLGIPGNIFIHLKEARFGQVVAGDGVLKNK